MTEKTIRHMVVFCLQYEPNSKEAERFLADGQRILSAIPGVQAFEVLRQIGKKNDYDYCFSMEFQDEAAYENYNAHPNHQNFVEERWKREVTEFLEIDLADRRH